MNDEFLKQQAAEIEAEMYGSFENPADVSEDEIGPEEAMIETEPMEMKPVNPEIIENAPPATAMVAGCPPLRLMPMCPPALQHQNWMPWLQYPVTAQGVFELALTVEPVDPARQQLGFFYEPQLKRECNMLIPRPIPSFFPRGIKKALRLRRSHPTIFVCQSIDIVLVYYLNNLGTENDNDLF